MEVRARPARATCSSPISRRRASLDRPAVVPTRAEFCFGMKSGGASTPTVRPEGVCQSRHFCRPSKRPDAGALVTEQPPRWSSPDCWKRTIWAARHPRSTPLWSESGGRGGVSDLGGGEQPTAEASAASTSGSPSARTRNVALCARRPRDARWNKSGLKDTLGLTLERLRAARRCISLRPIERRWPVLRNRGGRPPARGSRPPRAMIARGRAGAPRRMCAIARARRASRQARP
jgi:hypothetical protein